MRVSQEFPLITLRLMVVNPKEFPGHTEKIFADIDRYPGCVDSIWLPTETWYFCRSLNDVRKHAMRLLPYAEMCRQRNIQVGIQAATLGHNPSPVRNPNTYPFADDSWCIDEDGNTAYNCLCPSSPEVHKFLEESTKIYLEILKPDSFWPDDDMRLGTKGKMLCFCPRCIARFNAETSGNWTRETLVTALKSEKDSLAIRRQWVAFNGRMLGECAAAFRRAIDAVKPDCLLGLQRARSTNKYDSEDGSQFCRGLAGKQNEVIAIRAGGGFYHDLFPRDMIRKAFDVGREAARFSANGFRGGVCNEGESFPHVSVQKNPGTLMTEAAMVIAAGAKFATVYWHSPVNLESAENYDFFMQTLSDHYLFIKAVRETTLKTALAGCALYQGVEALALPDWQGETDETEERLLENGLPMSFPGAAPELFALSERSALSLGREDLAKCFAKPVLMDVKAFEILCKKFPELKFVKKVSLEYPGAGGPVIDLGAREQFSGGEIAEGVSKAIRRRESDVKLLTKIRNLTDDNVGASAIIPTEFGGKIVLVQFLNIWHGWTGYRRECILDALDEVVPGKMAVRLLTSGYAVCPFARVTSDGKAAGVFLLNAAAGNTPKLKIALRNPAYKKYRLQRQMAEPIDLKVIAQSDEEIILEIPSIAPWRAVFIEGVEK